MPSPTLPDQDGKGLIFEPHSLFGLNDPDGNPWPFGYVSEGIGRPIFELSVPALKPDDPSLLPLALKMTAATELLEALAAICDDLEIGDETSAEQVARHAGRAALAKAQGK